MGEKFSAVQEKMGAAMCLSWFLCLGPVGFVLLLGLAYAMVVQNLALGIICGLLAASPAVLMGLWVATGVVAAVMRRLSAKAPAAGTAVETLRAD